MNRNEPGSRAGQLPTGIKPIPTAIRQGTGYKPETALNRGVGGNVNVPNMNRVITSYGGVAGLKTAGGFGPNRQIYDRSFYMTQLNKKNKEIFQEINKMRKEMEDLVKDNQTYLQVEKKFEEVNKEVRNLEGRLADYNLAADKQRTNTRPEDIRAIYEHIKNQNEKQRNALDEIFLERKSQEEQINSIEIQLNEINQQAELKLNELDPEQKTEYEGLINENKQLMYQINMLRTELDQVNNAYLQSENKLRMDVNKLKAQEYKQSINYMENKKKDLEIQLNEQNLSFPEARDRLLARIKEDNSFMQTTDKRIKEIKKIIENYERRIKELQLDLEEKKGEEQDKQRYEILYQRDKEITEFINGFEETRKHEMENIYQLEHNIIDLLEQGSKSLALSGNLPSQEQFLHIQKDLENKTLHTENAETTLKRLQLEFEQRNLELKKLEQAEERIGPEMTTLTEKMEKMKEEMNTKFDNISLIKVQAEQKKKRYTEERDELRILKGKCSDDLKNIMYERDLKEKKLHLHEQFSLYTDFEKRMGQNEQQLYQLKAYINNKSKDMNYQGIQKDCLALIEDVNNMVQRQI